MPAISRDLVQNCQHCGIRFVVTPTQQAAAEDTRRLRVCPACRERTAATGRERGLVKWYNGRKGYGFISRAHGAELFVHRSGLSPGLTSLQTDDLVEFEVELSPKGVQARGVVVVAAS